MSRGRKAKTISNGATWEEIFNKSQGFYFQYIIIQLGRKTKCLTNENANDLLEKIKQKKEKLIAEKKLSKEKPLSPIEVDEIPFEIPKNWNWCRLAEICTHISDIDHNMPKAVKNGGVKFLSAKDLLNDGTINFDKDIKYISEEDFNRLGRKIIPKKNDIIYSRIGARLGKARIVENDERFIVSYSCCTIRTLNPSVKFLNSLLDSGFVLSQATRDTTSHSIPDLGMQKIKEFIIPIPPYSEQKIILEFLQDFGKNEINSEREYFDSEIEKDVISLHQAQTYNNQITTELSHQLELVRQLRQAFLREAMQGKLVPQNEQDEPAEILLEKIKAEKEKLIAEKKIKKDKPLAEIKAEEVPFEIPSNWVWCRLGELAEIVRGGSPRPAGDKRFYDGKIPFLKVGDLTATDYVFLNSHTFTIKEAGLHKTRMVEANTLMLTNSGATLGIPKICTFQTTFNDGIAAFLNIEKLNNVFLYYFLKSKSKWYLSEASRGQGQPNLNTDIIGNTLLALPPLAEQKRIVEKLEKLMKYCDELEANIRESKGQAESLLQVALKEALEPK
ncbi:MAG TPA: restriction endonuclease subunit S [Pyrinomonadaceae bacterium]|nr:restriction endonuclease subunit S [Pyrinomonadaceae bacterium]